MSWFFEDFKDNLIIDRHNPIFWGPLFRGKEGGETKKMKDLRDNDSEDALTWNVFSTLKSLDPNFWVKALLKSAFGERGDLSKLNFDCAVVVFWHKVSPPRCRPVAEGPSEPDLEIVTRDLLIFIEAKYLAPVAPDTTHDPERDQVIRLIDVGSYKAKQDGLDFFFILLTPRKVISEGKEPERLEKIEEYWGRFMEYRDHPDRIAKMLPYRSDDMDYSKMAQNIGWLHWEDIAGFLASADRRQFSSLENFMIQQLLQYLKAKGLSL